MTGRQTQLDNIHEELDGEFSRPTGSDPEYNPAQTESSSSDDDVKSLEKTSSFKESSSDEAVERPDTDSGEDKDQQTGKCNIKKHKTPRTYVKRKKKKEKMNKRQVKTVTIKNCTKRQDGKRSWDKKHFCLYCGKPLSKIARHLKRKHMNIKDVAYAFSFPVGSKYRKALLDLLRSKGDFKHNAKVLEKCRRQLLTCKQPSYKASDEDYLPCTYCYGMFARKELWKHQSSCGSKRSCMSDNETMPIDASFNECQKIINYMQQDDVSFHIRTDSLICRYGEGLYAKHERVKSRHQYIAQRMRELGRFMLVAKDMDKTVKGLEDVCAPSRFQFVVSVTKKVTEFSPGKNEYEKPPTAAQIRLGLKGAVEVLIRQTLMNDDDLAERKAKQFLELLNKNWKNHVSVSAHQTIQEKRWNKQDDIPLTKNVMTLRDHLRMVEDKAKEELTKELSLKAYKMLNETVLTQVIIFNKLHEEEASCLTLNTYKTACTNPVTEDIYETLSPLEKELSKLLTRIEVQGKRGRKVPVFLTERMNESIDLLIKRREEAGIPAENPYLFAKPGAMTNIRGCDCLRKYAEESKAQNPELLRSTKLRKQVATLCQLLDLSEQELEQVERFMGHDIRVHSDFYRKMDKTFQIAKISNLLFAIEQSTETLKGKTLNTINLSVSGESPTSISDIGPQNKGIPGRVDSDDGCPDLISTQKRPGPCREDETSDVDVENPMSDSETVQHTGRTRAREVDDDGCLDLSFPKKRLDPCNEDDQSPGISLSQRLSPGMKRRKKKKAEKQMDEGSDLLCPEKIANQSSEDGSSDRDDQRSGKNLVTQKKKKGKREKQMVKGKEPLQATARKPWSEAERMAVEKHLGNFLAERRVPGKEDCLRAIQAEKVLCERSWKNVKDYVCNKIVTLNRRSAIRILKY